MMLAPMSVGGISDEAVRFLPPTLLCMPSSKSNDGGLSPLSQDYPARTIPDEAVRSRPLSSLWPHLSASPWGGVIPTAASGSLMGPVVGPHHSDLSHSTASRIREGFDYLIASKYVLLLVFVSFANEQTILADS